MTGQLRKPPPRAAWVAASDKAEGLERIADPGIAAAIWRRPRDPDLGGWLDALPPAQLPRLRQALDLADVASSVQAACVLAGLAAPAVTALAEDVAALARRFGAIMAAPRVHLRLDVIQHNACHKFHCDRVVARLLCSYRGQGTEFGPAKAAGEVCGLNQLATHEAAIFRGTLWPGEDCGLLHRSPPIAGTGETRLLLVIDLPEQD